MMRSEEQLKKRIDELETIVLTTEKKIDVFEYIYERIA
jgi:hypothetical protein